jgi:multidrug efflux pump subunit AcrB
MIGTHAGEFGRREGAGRPRVAEPLVLRGMVLVEAIRHACELRFRPILMRPAIAIIAGLVVEFPLVLLPFRR